MGIEVLHMIGIDLGITQSADHGTAWAVHVGGSHVTGIGAATIANQLSVNTRTTSFGVFVLFEDHHTCAFTQHKTIAVAVPRTRSALWVVVSG